MTALALQLVLAAAPLTPVEQMTRNQLSGAWWRLSQQRPRIGWPIASLVTGGVVFAGSGTVVALWGWLRTRGGPGWNTQTLVGSATTAAIGAGLLLVGVWWLAQVRPEWVEVGAQMDAVLARIVELDERGPEAIAPPP